MVTFLEGPDGGGKTTLARHLCDRYNLEYVHNGPPPPDEVDLYTYYRKQWLETRQLGNVVFDRWALGERVYGHVLRGHSRLNHEDWIRLEAETLAHGAKHVMCLPSVDFCYGQWRERKRTELIQDPQTFLRMYAEYAYVLSADTQSFHYDFWLKQNDKQLHAYLTNSVTHLR